MSPVRKRIASLVATGALAGGGWLVWSPGEAPHCGCLAHQPAPTEACLAWFEAKVDRLDMCLARRKQRLQSLQGLNRRIL